MPPSQSVLESVRSTLEDGGTVVSLFGESDVNGCGAGSLEDVFLCVMELIASNLFVGKEVDRVLSVLFGQVDRLSCLNAARILLHIVDSVSVEHCGKSLEVIPSLFLRLKNSEAVDFSQLGIPTTSVVGFQDFFFEKLLKTDFSKSIFCSLISILKEVDVTEQQKHQCVEKSSKFFAEEIWLPQELSQIIPDLLVLSRKWKTRNLMVIVINYMAKSDSAPQSSEGEDLPESHEHIGFQGMLISKFYYCSLQDKNLPKDVIGLLQSREIKMSDFSLILLLSLARINRYHGPILKFLKGYILDSLEPHLSMKNMDIFEDMEKIVLRVSKISSADWEFVSSSLVSLAFCLMEVPESKSASSGAKNNWKVSKRPGPNEKSHDIGFRMLGQIFKDRRTSHKYIIEEVLSRIATHDNRWLSVLSYMTRKFSHNFAYYSSSLKELVDFVYTFSLKTADKLFCAVTPVFGLAPDLKDHLVITLRKMMFHRNPVPRACAVLGFFAILEHLQSYVDNGAPSSSQCSQFEPSGQHQLSEIVCFLRRSMNDVDDLVRRTLYLKIANTVSVPAIGEISSLLCSQIYRYYDPEGLHPIDVSKCVNGNKIIEPIGELLLACVRCVNHEGCSRELKSCFQDVYTRMREIQSLEDLIGSQESSSNPKTESIKYIIEVCLASTFTNVPPDISNLGGDYQRECLQNAATFFDKLKLFSLSESGEISDRSNSSNGRKSTIQHRRFPLDWSVGLISAVLTSNENSSLASDTAEFMLMYSLDIVQSTIRVHSSEMTLSKEDIILLRKTADVMSEHMLAFVNAFESRRILIERYLSCFRDVLFYVTDISSEFLKFTEGPAIRLDSFSGKSHLSTLENVFAFMFPKEFSEEVCITLNAMDLACSGDDDLSEHLKWLQNIDEAVNTESISVSMALVKHKYLVLERSGSSTLQFLMVCASDVSSSLGSIQDDVVSQPDKRILNELTIPSVLGWLLIRLESELDSVHFFIQHLARVNLSKFRTTDDVQESKALLDNISVWLTSLSKILHILSQSRLNQSMCQIFCKTMLKLFKTAVLFTSASFNSSKIPSDKFKSLIHFLLKTVIGDVQRLISFTHVQTEGFARSSTGILKDISSIPGLIFQIERFENTVRRFSNTMSSNQMKLSKWIKRCAARDFRIVESDRQDSS
eukprot:231525_1